MKTFNAKPGEIERQWYVIDASELPLGRLAVAIANLLRGKHKPSFTPNTDVGDFVVVINAAKLNVTGKKFTQKLYRWHTGYPGGFRELTFAQMMEKSPERVLEKAVKGMLPHNRLSNRQILKLKVYDGATHPHDAQMPKILSFASSGATASNEVPA